MTCPQYHLTSWLMLTWLYGYDRLSLVTGGERVDAQDAPVANGSFRYAYDGIGRPSDFIAWSES